jgi:Uma2 family endonuclease
MPEVPQASAFELAPDWICEVLSPSTEAKDRADKLPIYARERCAHAWLVRPASETLEVYRLDGETYRLIVTYHGHKAVRAEPFDAIELDLGALWQR